MLLVVLFFARRCLKKLLFVLVRTEGGVKLKKVVNSVRVERPSVIHCIEVDNSQRSNEITNVTFVIALKHRAECLLFSGHLLPV